MDAGGGDRVGDEGDTVCGVAHGRGVMEEPVVGLGAGGAVYVGGKFL